MDAVILTILLAAVALLGGLLASAYFILLGPEERLLRAEEKKARALGRLAEHDAKAAEGRVRLEQEVRDLGGVIDMLRSKFERR